MIRTEVRDGSILWVTLDDPAALNALDEQSMKDLEATWSRFAQDDSLRIAVITGAGSKAFGVGSNLKTLIPRIQSGEVGHRIHQGAYMKDTGMQPIYKPIIGAVNGDCLGGGLEVLSYTDIRLTVSHARFGLPEVCLGLFPAGGGTVRLMRQLSYVHAMELLMTGEFISADRAVEIGLVNRIVDADDLHEEAMKIARKVLANGNFAVQRVKESALRSVDLTLNDAYALEDKISEDVFTSPEAAEGLSAFYARRTPDFETARQA